MFMSLSFRPEEVLDVPAGVSLETLRTAYREKVRKHHPDQGGDAWAFRVVNESFEILCRNRVSARVEEEEKRAAEHPERRPEAEPRAHQSPPPSPEMSEIAGIHDSVGDPAALLDVELLLIRFAIEDPTEFLLTSPEQRNLSCSMSVYWPAKGQELNLEPRQVKSRIKEIDKLVKRVAKESRPVGQTQQGSDELYMAWLTFPTAQGANQAFRAFHKLVRDAGLGVRQRTRELIVDRPQP